MPWIKAHCADCENLLGNDYRDVHEFLDQYAKIFDVSIFTEYHRSFLHNRAGLAAIISRWGLEAGIAGIIHLSRDYHELRMDDKDMEWILKNFDKVLLYFHNMDNFEPNIDPRVVEGWGKDSLCFIAFGKNGYDQYYRNICDI